MTITEAQLSERTFGVELEYEGITQEKAARTVARVLGSEARYEGYHLHNWVIPTADGRKWQVVSDGSLCGGAEVVTPILTYADMNTLQDVVRALRKAGAKANIRTGLHVHVGAADFTAKNVANLIKTFYRQECLVLKAAGTVSERLGHYTRPTDRRFVDRICAMATPTMDAINTAWFGTFTPHPQHYNPARYRTLNISPLWEAKRTFELRFLNGTTHAGEVRAGVEFALLLAIRAKSAKAASGRRQRPAGGMDEKYAMRCFLIRLGANGPLFKTLRHHFGKHMGGRAAWRDGRHD